MNVAAHQDKKKNEKTGKKKAEERRREIDFKEAACYLSAVVQGQHGEKNNLCGGSPLGNWDSQEG